MKRRHFMQMGLISAGSVILASCESKEKKAIPPENRNRITEPDPMTLSKSIPKEQVHQLLDQKVAYYMNISHNCAQSSFLALSEQFGLGNEDMVKALTPIPGIAERGETCGAVTGSLLAIGLVFGSTHLDDWQAYRDSLEPANEFCDRFADETGSTMCSRIIEARFGQKLDLRNEEDLDIFRKLDATTKCTSVVQTAVKIAADIILGS